ncbi:MAG: glycosyltransferase family 2 protein [Allosphingosinicella sp.]
MAKFAVCIPVYNGAAFLAQALDSVAEQSFHDLEVIVSDNGSTDGTAAILDQWSGRLPMRVVRRPATLPILDHFNALLDEVDSDAYMVLCHDDYLARPDAIALASDALARHPDISSVYCDLLYVSETRRRLAHRRFGRAGRFDGDETGRRSLRTARNLFGIPLAVRRSALGDRRYDPAFRYAGDLDLSWALARVAAPWHIAEPLIANRYGGQNSTWSMLAGARREFLLLADKFGVEMNPLGRARLTLTAFQVAQQKRMFGAYARFHS